MSSSRHHGNNHNKSFSRLVLNLRYCLAKTYYPEGNPPKTLFDKIFYIPSIPKISLN